MPTAWRRAAPMTALVLLLMTLGSCADGESGDADEAGAAAGEGVSQVSGFTAPFTIELADWLVAEPTLESQHFMTWSSSDEQRALRVLSPVAVYRPGAKKAGAPPADLGAQLRSLKAHGALVSHVRQEDIDGHTATVMTLRLPAGMDNSLDGTLGCPANGMAAMDCFGPQDEYALRVAALKVDGTPVVIWERDSFEADVDYTSFDQMLASIRFD